MNQIKLHGTDGYKQYKQRIIIYMKNRFNDITLNVKEALITRDFIIETMVKDKIIKSDNIRDLPHEANQFIKTLITHHNRAHMLYEYGEIYDKLNTGKYQYILNFTVRIRDISKDKVYYYKDVRSAEFKSEVTENLISKKQIYYIIQMYYIWKDYQVIDEILSYKLTKMDNTANIKKWNYGKLDLAEDFVIVCLNMLMTQYRIGTKKHYKTIINNVLLYF